VKSLLPYGNRNEMSEKSRAHNSAGRPSCQDRPQQDSQTAFSAMVRCTSVRRCLIRALIKSQNREREGGGGREKERENLCVCVCVCVRACVRACVYCHFALAHP